MNDLAREFWLFFCLGIKVRPLMLWVLPFWKDGFLWVSHEVKGDIRGFEKVIICMAHAMKWMRFSETRWGVVHKSGKMMVCSLACGMSPLTDMVLADRRLYSPHLGGVTRIDRSLLWLCTQSSHSWSR